MYTLRLRILLDYQGAVNSLLLLSDPFRGREVVMCLAMRVKEIMIARQFLQIDY